MNSNTAASPASADVLALAADYRESLVVRARLRPVADDATDTALFDEARAIARTLRNLGRADLATSIAYDVNIAHNY